MVMAIDWPGERGMGRESRAEGVEGAGVTSTSTIPLPARPPLPEDASAAAAAVAVTAMALLELVGRPREVRCVSAKRQCAGLRDGCLCAARREQMQSRAPGRVRVGLVRGEV